MCYMFNKCRLCQYSINTILQLQQQYMRRLMVSGCASTASTPKCSSRTYTCVGCLASNDCPVSGSSCTANTCAAPDDNFDGCPTEDGTTFRLASGQAYTLHCTTRCYAINAQDEFRLLLANIQACDSRCSARAATLTPNDVHRCQHVVFDYNQIVNSEINCMELVPVQEQQPEMLGSMQLFVYNLFQSLVYTELRKLLRRKLEYNLCNV